MRVDAATDRDLVLIHTNDTHGRLVPPITDRVRRLRESLPGSLLVDAGDAVSAGNLGFRPRGEPALRWMTELGYDALALGNRETHPRKEIFPLKVRDAGFPLLCANMLAAGSAPLPVRPHVVVMRGGWRVGLFGLTVQMFTKKSWSRALCDYWFEAPIPVARRVCAELRPQVDLLVALTHLGHTLDRELAAACPELDVVVGGHSHTNLLEPDRSCGAPILHAWAYGYVAGVARFRREGAGGPGLVSWERVRLRDDAPADSPGPDCAPE